MRFKLYEGKQNIRLNEFMTQDKIISISPDETVKKYANNIEQCVNAIRQLIGLALQAKGQDSGKRSLCQKFLDASNNLVGSLNDLISEYRDIENAFKGKSSKKHYGYEGGLEKLNSDLKKYKTNLNDTKKDMVNTYNELKGMNISSTSKDLDASRLELLRLVNGIYNELKKRENDFFLQMQKDVKEISSSPDDLDDDAKAEKSDDEEFQRKAQEEEKQRVLSNLPFSQEVKKYPYMHKQEIAKTLKYLQQKYYLGGVKENIDENIDTLINLLYRQTKWNMIAPQTRFPFDIILGTNGTIDNKSVRAAIGLLQMPAFPKKEINPESAPWLFSKKFYNQFKDTDQLTKAINIMEIARDSKKREKYFGGDVDINNEPMDENRFYVGGKKGINNDVLPYNQMVSQFNKFARQKQKIDDNDPDNENGNSYKQGKNQTTRIGRDDYTKLQNAYKQFRPILDNMKRYDQYKDVSDLTDTLAKLVNLQK